MKGWRGDVHARVRQSLEQVVAWVRRHEYTGYEPADGNASRVSALTRGRVLPMRVLQQLVLRAPVNIRGLLGIAPHESPIARGYLAWGYGVMHRQGGGDWLREEAIACLQWLIAARSGRAGEHCWGDPYDYATRAGRRARGEPLLIWSALIGQAFVDAYEAWGDERYLRVAEGTAAWILGLPREVTPRGSCLSYVGTRRSSIHNANAMGAAFLGRVAAITGNEECLAVAKSAMTYTGSRQRADGSWYYAEDPRFWWIDNFHTGYNLSALKTYRETTKDRSYDGCVTEGLRFYKTRFFEADGRPKYFHDSVYPIDIQCAAQAIETLASFAEEDPECLAIATRVADWTIENMQARDGHFYYRDLGWKKVRTPMLHWGQATMVKALATLLGALHTTERWSGRRAAIGGA